MAGNLGKLLPEPQDHAATYDQHGRVIFGGKLNQSAVLHKVSYRALGDHKIRLLSVGRHHVEEDEEALDDEVIVKLFGHHREVLLSLQLSFLSDTPGPLPPSLQTCSHTKPEMVKGCKSFVKIRLATY